MLRNHAAVQIVTRSPIHVLYVTNHIRGRLTWRLIWILKSHSDAKPCSCSFCYKSLGRKAYLQTHSRTHTGDKPSESNLCKKGKPAERKADDDHGTDDKNPSQPSGQSIADCEAAASGESTAVTTRRHECSVWGKRFTFNSILQAHMQCHVGTKCFKCPVCQKTFAYSKSRYDHMRIHTGDKRFACYVCSKRFFTNGELKNHAQSHVTGKHFSCVICKKAFKQSRCLKAHMRLHTR